MIAVNKTSTLWSKRLPVLARETRKTSAALDVITPQCCFLLCNVCCWVASC